MKGLNRMTKILTIASIFSIFTAIQADEFNKMKKLLDKAKPSNQTELALNLGAKGSLYHTQENYTEAIKYYTQSLDLRKKLGMERTNGYANLLFLSAIAESKLGNDCAAADKTHKVVEIYKQIGSNEEADLAEKEGLTPFKKSCQEKLISSNSL